MFSSATHSGGSGDGRLQQNNQPSLAFPSLEKIKVYPPSLVELCLRKIANNFMRFNPTILQRELSKAKQISEVYAILDCDIPLIAAATIINDEFYWKRRCLHRDRGEFTGLIDDHGMCWKQFYLETEFEAILEKFPLDFQQFELDEMKSIVMAIRPWIFKLRIKQYPSHYDLSAILDPLPNLCSLQITYGRKRFGMEYERGLFGMKIVDCQYLVRYIRCAQTLICLSLPCNMIDDELVKILMSGLEAAYMLMDLDLSHNNIGDRGARRIAKLLDSKKYLLERLDLSDNSIHANGAMHIGSRLAENQTLDTLNLRLNRCEDNGICHLLQDLCINKRLRTVNVSSNDLTHRCLAYLSSMISENTALEEIDLSGNPLFSAEELDEKSLPTTDPDQLDPDSPFGVLLMCVQKNKTLLKLDVRQCNLPQFLEKRLHKITKHRELQHRGISVDAYEKAELVDKEAQAAAAAAAAAAEAEKVKLEAEKAGKEGTEAATEGGEAAAPAEGEEEGDPEEEDGNAEEAQA